MPVQLMVEAGPHRGIARAALVRAAEAMLVAAGMKDHELSIVLTGDDEIQKLNREYRQKDRPTDVLAFAQREGEWGESAGKLLGDVVVSVPTARRQATEKGWSLRSEIHWLMAHGLLHLLGWDHDTVARDRLMRAETKRLCAAAEAKAAVPKARRRGARRP